MNSFETLPNYYEMIAGMNLLEDEKMFKTIKRISVILYVLLPVPGLFIVPPVMPTLKTFLKIIIAAAGTFLYICLHEAVHGIFMKLYGAKKVNYGFKMGCAYAGTASYFKKIPYSVIAMAPVVILGILLLALNMLLGAEWFWVIYFIQIVNISGAAGDFYVFYKLWKLPADSLITDSGTEIKVYVNKN